MIKPYHQLTKAEFAALVAEHGENGNGERWTFERLAEDYPQPEWCRYHDAIMAAVKQEAGQP